MPAIFRGFSPVSVPLYAAYIQEDDTIEFAPVLALAAYEFPWEDSENGYMAFRAVTVMDSMAGADADLSINYLGLTYEHRDCPTVREEFKGQIADWKSSHDTGMRLDINESLEELG